MEKVQWDDSLSVGVKLIDEQHKTLIQRLIDVSAAIDAHHGEQEIVKTLGFLFDYTDFHFLTEEKHMEKHDYPGLAEQKVKHKEFLETLKSLEQDFVEDGSTHDLADAINTFLFNWLVTHIRGLDQGLGAYLTEKGIVITEED